MLEIKGLNHATAGCFRSNATTLRNVCWVLTRHTGLHLQLAIGLSTNLYFLIVTCGRHVARPGIFNVTKLPRGSRKASLTGGNPTPNIPNNLILLSSASMVQALLTWSLELKFRRMWEFIWSLEHCLTMTRSEHPSPRCALGDGPSGEISHMFGSV